MAASYFSFVSTALWAILSIPVAVKYLSREEIGLWTVVNAFLSYLIWMDFGISHAIGRLMAPSITKHDQPEIDRWWSVASFALWLQACLLFLVGWAMISLIIRLLGIPDSIQADAYWLLLAGVTATAFSLPLRRVPGFLVAQERFHWVPLVQGIVPWCNFVVFLSLLKMGWGIKSYIWAVAASQVFNWVVYSILIKTGPDRPRWNREGITAERFKRLFKFSGSLMAVGLGESIINSLPAMMLARLGGLGLVPVYNFTSRGPFLGFSLIARTYQAFQPGWQKAFVTGRYQDFKTKHKAGGMITLGLANCGAFVVIAANPILVKVLAGDDFFAGHSTNAWFAVGMIAAPMGYYFQSLLTLSGTMGKSALVSLGKVLAGFGLALIAWKWYGLSGMAAAFSLLPLVNGIYGYMSGVRSCGFRRHEVSPTVAVCTLISMTLTLLTGLYIGHGYRWAGEYIVLGKTLHLPEWQPLAPALILVVLGLGLITHGLLCLKHGKADLEGGPMAPGNPNPKRMTNS